MELVAYLRQSSATGLDAYGLPNQRADIESYCQRNGHTVVKWCEDRAVSGTVEAWDREGLNCALTAVVEEAAQGIVVARLDRLARSLTVQEAALAMVWRSGGELHAADSGLVPADDPDDPMRTAMRQMMGVFAELDRSMTVLKMRKGRDAKRRSGGKATGRYPFGESKEGPVAREQMVLAAMREMRETYSTWATIAAELNRRGTEFAPRHAAKWSDTTAYRVGMRAGIQ